MEKAKERLINAALKLFAEGGYLGTSTRDIVKEAGVNISAIAYYFEGKEGLYRAVLEYIVGFMKEGMKENILDIIPLIEEKSLEKEEARALLLKAIENMINFICGDTISPHMVELIMREQISPSNNADVIYPEFIFPMHKALTFLFAKATEQNPASKTAILEAHSILGQVLVFKTHQGFMNKRLNIKNYKSDIDKIIEIILKHTNAILDSYVNGTGEQI